MVTDFDIVYWELSIYNKWGEVLFVEDNPEIGWDGTFSGTECQDGVYVYKVKYKSCANPFVMEMKTGFVNLIR